MKKNSIYFFLLVTFLVSIATSLAVTLIREKKPAAYFYNNNSSQTRSVDFTAEQYPDFTYAAESAVKAVVHVKVVKKGVEQPYNLFGFFFGYGPQQPRDQVGVGSGVIISDDGYIVTNNHVISGADEIEVTLENKQIMKAKLIGADPVTDVALLKIDAANLPVLPFGDSDALRLGEWVLAIGNPYDLRYTVTAGIVSAKARSMPSMDNEFKIEAFIQTDAAVNSGNSGGALINTKGELVGINTAIAPSVTGDFTGYAFAVPTTIVKKTVEDLMDFGSVKRALMGITMREIDGNLVTEKGLKDTRGVYIVEVIKGGAAEKGGLKSGDVLLSINNVSVNSAPAVQEQVSRYRPSENIKLKLLRGDKEIDATVTLADAGTEPLIAERSEVVRLFGAELAEAGQEQLEKSGVDSGVEVLSVSEGKFRDTGIKQGFIITHINQSRIRNMEDLLSVIQRSRRSILIEGVYPDGETAYYGMGI